MAQAIITITDEPNGNINIHLEFEPAVSNDTVSAAQSTAVRFVEMLKREDQEQQPVSRVGVDHNHIDSEGGHPD